MATKFKRYTMVIRRDENGYATPALKVRQKGEVLKFDEVKDLLKITDEIAAIIQVAEGFKKMSCPDSKLVELIIENLRQLLKEPEEICSWCLDTADVEIKIERGERYCSRCGRELLLS